MMHRPRFGSGDDGFGDDSDGVLGGGPNGCGCHGDAVAVPPHLLDEIGSAFVTVSDIEGMPADLAERLLRGLLFDGVMDSPVDVGLKDFLLAAKEELAVRFPGDFVSWANPGYVRPLHLGPALEKIASLTVPDSRGLVHAPPRHAKTVTFLSGLVRLLKLDPTKHYAYVSYSAEVARTKSRLARDMALRAGLHPNRDRWAANDWYLKEGGRFFATGINGEILSYGFDGIIIDDPIKNRMEAESPAQRNKRWDWLWDTCMSRLEPGGFMVVMMHRWHRDDMFGRLSREYGWPEVWLPAIAEEDDPYGRVCGSALWPERWPVRSFDRVRRRPYTWRSIYQGRPTGRGTEVFIGANYYDSVPDDAVIFNKRRSLLVVCGIDLASSTGKSSDKSGAVVLKTDGKKVYVVRATQRRVRTPKFIPELKRIKREFRGVRFKWHYSGMEKGSGDFIKEKGIKIDMVPARDSKLIRAEPVADEWNRGNVLIPSDAEANPWVESFLDTVLNFTGAKGGDDDIVDALASGYSKLKSMLRALKRRRRRGSVKVY